MEVNCNGKGVCREVRKCIISCLDAIAHGAASLKNVALSPIGSSAVQCGAAVHWYTHNDLFRTDEQLEVPQGEIPQGHKAL
jgi:hypothetical protein